MSLLLLLLLVAVVVVVVVAVGCCCGCWLLLLLLSLLLLLLVAVVVAVCFCCCCCCSCCWFLLFVVVVVVVVVAVVVIAIVIVVVVGGGFMFKYMVHTCLYCMYFYYFPGSVQGTRDVIICITAGWQLITMRMQLLKIGDAMGSDGGLDMGARSGKVNLSQNMAKLGKMCDNLEI